MEAVEGNQISWLALPLEQNYGLNLVVDDPDGNGVGSARLDDMADPSRARSPQ
jgi:hypothetical protein